MNKLFKPAMKKPTFPIPHIGAPSPASQEIESADYEKTEKPHENKHANVVLESLSNLTSCVTLAMAGLALRAYHEEIGIPDWGAWPLMFFVIASSMWLFLSLQVKTLARAQPKTTRALPKIAFFAVGGAFLLISLWLFGATAMAGASAMNVETKKAEDPVTTMCVKTEVLSLTKHDNQGLRPEMTSDLQ